MIHGIYSDNEEVTLLNGSLGVIVQSLGHTILLGRNPDNSKGPRYKVRLNNNQEVTVEELEDHTLKIV